VRRFTPALLAAISLIATTSAASAPDPRAEKERFTAADQALARKAILGRADIAPAWQRIPSPQEPNPDNESGCPGFRPDFSAFTLTGHATSAYRYVSAGATMISAVDVYKNERDARGSFQNGAKPQLARCLRHAVASELKTEPRMQATIVSARMVDAPKACRCDRAAAYRVVTQITVQSRGLAMYADFLVFRRGRSIGSFLAIVPGRPLTDREALARLMASRMR
jgi:hypothetical protein